MNTGDWQRGPLAQQGMSQGYGTPRDGTGDRSLTESSGKGRQPQGWAAMAPRHGYGEAPGSASAPGQHRLCCACHPATSPLGRARLVFPTKTWRTCTRSGAPRCCLSGCPRRGPGAWGMTVTANGTYCWCPVRIWPCDGRSPVKRGVSLSLKESSSWWKANKIPL